MALIKKNVRAIWTPAAELLGANALNGATRRWILSDNTLSTASSAIPSTGWFGPYDMRGADFCALQSAFKITAITLGGATTCTQAAMHVFGFGLPNVGAAAPFNAPPATLANQTADSTELMGHMPLATLWSGTDGVTGYDVNNAGTMTKSAFGLIGDTSAPTVNDVTGNWCWLGLPQSNEDAGRVATECRLPRMSGVDQIWLAIDLNPILAVSNITALTLDGSIKLIEYQDVDRVIMLDPRKEPRQDRK
jgi:hypothetical protein